MLPALPFRRSVVALGLFGTTLFSAIATGLLFSLPFALLLCAGVALALIVGLLWSSVQSLAGQTPLTLDEALSLGAPSAEEEQKRSVLRALKDLEYERSVGKIGEDDYAELSARYRVEARRLMAVLDEASAPARALAEKLAAERLAKADGAASSPADKDVAAAVADAAPVSDATSSPPSEPAPSGSRERRCADCTTSNDADAVFCKRCGAALSSDAGAKEKSP